MRLIKGTKKNSCKRTVVVVKHTVKVKKKTFMQRRLDIHYYANFVYEWNSMLLMNGFSSYRPEICISLFQAFMRFSTMPEKFSFQMEKCWSVVWSMDHKKKSHITTKCYLHKRESFQLITADACMEQTSPLLISGVTCTKEQSPIATPNETGAEGGNFAVNIKCTKENSPLLVSTTASTKIHSWYKLLLCWFWLMPCGGWLLNVQAAG